MLRLNAPRLRAAYAEHPPVQLEDLAVDAYVDLTEQGYRLLLDRLAFDLEGERWGDARLLLQESRAEQHWRLQADRLNVAPIANLARALAPLPETAVETLGALQPSGTLRNLRADFYPSWIRRSDCALRPTRADQLQRAELDSRSRQWQRQHPW